MSTLQERIAHLMEKTGLKVSEIARITGVSSSAVTQWKDGPTQSLKTAPATKLAEATGFSAMWIATGTGSAHVDPQRVGSKGFDANVKPVFAGLRAYPVISKIQAGKVKEITCPYEPGDGYAVEFGDDDASEWAFFLEIDGDSMLPEFNPGDRVRIDPEVAPRPGDYVAAKNSSEESTFKKYRVRGIDLTGKEIFELVPLNDNYPVMRSDEHELKVIGTMTEHRRKYRRK
ncbi:MAG: peptidase S24 [Comamonas sp.]|uniref:LexA family protein n=1 Tax=Comamonas sp. TaxID=34028 RepID=UPI002649489D|nr:S24 family peptidase [Comamonas sp.]MDN5503243.1 peptidase S24 [Comamonas sp.]MDN5536483.1 peptidase S24 [Comamonas sp.]